MGFMKKRSNDGNPSNKRRQKSKGNNFTGPNQHRFGRVMAQPPKLKLNSGQYPTVSIAVPGSVVSNAQTRELQTQLAGQIARAAVVFRVDEVVVFDDGLGSTLKTLSNYKRGPRRNEGEEQTSEQSQDKKLDHQQPSTDPHAFLARILQYCECPQYLRRKFFPMHPDLQFAGLLPPLDAPHHLRRGDVSSFREGVVVDKDAGEDGSSVDCGVPNTLVQIDRVLSPGLRCTVQLDPKSYATSKKGSMKGIVVSPTTPRDQDGIYWGYTTRMASSIKAIFDECPYDGGYDMKVGTSERGDVSIDNPKFRLAKKDSMKKSDGAEERFNHLIIVFGGVAGIEESVDADESMPLSGEDSKKMFDVWVNIAPYQGSRTIRTEEAVFITLSRLSPYIAKNGLASAETEKASPIKQKAVVKTDDVEFSDEALSDESSDDEQS
jgi:predicted SPOUT superfamily RNA methylase MTH1